MAYNYELGLGHGIKDCYPLFNTVCGRVDMVDPNLTMTQRWIICHYVKIKPLVVTLLVSPPPHNTTGRCVSVPGHIYLN